MNETIELGCVFHDSPQRKSTLRETGILGSKHTVKFSKGAMRRVKNRERKGPSQGAMQKCVSGAPAKTPGNWQRMFTLSKRSPRIRSILLLKLRYCWHRLRQPEDRHIVIDSGAFMHTSRKKNLSSSRDLNPPTNSGDSQ